MHGPMNVKLLVIPVQDSSIPGWSQQWLLRVTKCTTLSDLCGQQLA